MFKAIANLVGWRLGDSSEADRAAADAETAEQSIEVRMERVARRLKERGYAALDPKELDELAEDLAKIVQFVEHALVILDAAGHLESVGASIRRLRWVRTRVENLRSRRDQLAAAG